MSNAIGFGLYSSLRCFRRLKVYPAVLTYWQIVEMRHLTPFMTPFNGPPMGTCVMEKSFSAQFKSYSGIFFHEQKNFRVCAYY